MNQPKIKLFDQEWDVLKVEFDYDTGELKYITYKQYHGWTNFIVQGDVDRPRVHPHQDYVIVPDLNALFI